MKEELNMIEKMNDFFAARIDGYDEHMLTEVDGCKEGYKRIAQLVPCDTNNLLDLGCGTGLELDEIFKMYPNIEVTGIDLSKEMLNCLKQKHPDKKLKLINDDYFKYEFGKDFDCAVSFQTMHHFEKGEKVKLYRKIKESIRVGGTYIECDYMVTEQKTEDLLFAESKRLKQEFLLSDNELYHIDIPCTVENQTELMIKAGFGKVEKVFRAGNTTIIVAYV